MWHLGRAFTFFTLCTTPFVDAACRRRLSHDRRYAHDIGKINQSLNGNREFFTQRFDEDCGMVSHLEWLSIKQQGDFQD
jgi:hypothetical protein